MCGSHQEGVANTLSLTYWVEEITNGFEKYVQVLFLQQRKKLILDFFQNRFKTNGTHTGFVFFSKFYCLIFFLKIHLYIYF